MLNSTCRYEEVRQQWENEFLKNNNMTTAMISDTEITDTVSKYLAKVQEDGDLTISGLQQLARTIGVESPEKIHLKTMLIHTIQSISQNRICFRVASESNCRDIECKWRSECKKLIAEWCNDH
jgi:hypothetical protein